MDDELLFRVLFVASYALFAGVRIYYRGKTIGRESEKDYEVMDKSTVFLSIAILGYLALVIIYVLLPDFISWTYIGLPTMIRWFGFGLALIGTGLTLLTHKTLGAQYSAKREIQKEHVIISEGIYSHVRHPMYTSMNAFSIAVAIMSSNLLLIIFAFLVALPFPWLARKEEAMLIDQFGDDYREYMKGTGRFLPLLRKQVDDDGFKIDSQ
ncbi:MAG: methyltransferase [Candidatus Thorarchaeota archaeon]